VDHFARAQVDNFDRPLVLSWNEQALPLMSTAMWSK